MYRSCIFCSADLGANEVLEEFPVGRRVAFDAWKGRLWVVCRQCTRWNLSPLEERWEAVEAAEKLFRDSRLRVQSENIGLAKLPDGTRLIRVGKALPGELAAWRYGGQLLRRRRNYLFAAGAAGVGLVAWGGLAFAGVLGGAGGLLIWGNLYLQHRRGLRVVHRVPAEQSHTGEELLLRRHHLSGAQITSDGTSGELSLYLPYAFRPTPVTGPEGQTEWLGWRGLELTGASARSVLARTMVDANASGASRSRLERALARLTDAGGAEGYLERVSREGARLRVGYPHFRPDLSWRRFVGSLRGERVPAGSPPSGWEFRYRPYLESPDTLALEMALHEESERRALEGELAALEAAWREAEEIAQIADVLPDDPLEKLERKEQEK